MASWGVGHRKVLSVGALRWCPMFRLISQNLLAFDRSRQGSESAFCNDQVDFEGILEDIFAE